MIFLGVGLFKLTLIHICLGRQVGKRYSVHKLVFSSCLDASLAFVALGVQSLGGVSGQGMQTLCE